MQTGNEQAEAAIETSARHKFFKEKLREMGMYDIDSDYDGMIGRAVEELSATFAGQGHSGMSAAITISLFNKLMDEYQNQITPEMPSPTAGPTEYPPFVGPTEGTETPPA
jgi:hypothetical protein